MSTTVTTASTDSPPPTFFPSKRRKLQLRRRRSDSASSSSIPDELPRPGSASPVEPGSTSDHPSSTFPSRPRVQKHRFGLEVSPQKPALPPDPPSDEARAAATADAEVQAVINRFTQQTGQILDVDKHMMTYIESRMAAKNGLATDSQSNSTNQQAQGGETASSSNSYWAPTRPEARGATLGKLHEVDLGEEVKQRNIALTQAATRALESGIPPVQPQPETRKGRRRRNQQDLERDRLVEEVLKETRLDLYTEEVEEEEAIGDGEGAADDRIAERFRKEFIDAIVSKRRRKGGETRGAKGKKEDKKRPKGPKLGGSRMARAQMRERETVVRK